MKIRLRTLLVAGIAAVALAGGAAGLVVWLGVYDIAATHQHTSPVYRLLQVALRRAVIARADTTPAVPELSSVARVRDGAWHYRTHCVQCHGAPGVPPEPFAFGLRPAPASLIPSGRDWEPREIFWVVRHGIKMTGMPAWQYRLDDDQIWSVTAFVKAMPRMSVPQYRELSASLPAYQDASLAEPAVRPGDVEAGRRATAQYLCATCHRIPGFVSADHHVGPPLNGIGGRALIGGVLANTPENMVRWLRNPQAVDPLSAMPPLGLSEQDARDVAAFLYTLDQVAHK